MNMSNVETQDSELIYELEVNPPFFIILFNNTSKLISK